MEEEEEEKNTKLVERLIRENSITMTEINSRGSCHMMNR